MYHGIILCGLRTGTAGKQIAGFRLRTAAKKHGYNILTMDSATAMSQTELESVLDSVITDKTLMIGISTVWLSALGSNDVVPWLNQGFFNRLKLKYPKLKIVAGGNGVIRLLGAMSIYESCDWHIKGFSDESFPRLLMMLAGRPNHGLKYFVDHHGKRTIDSNKFHQITHPDDIETIWLPEDDVKSHQPLPLEVSRGCIFRCAFCNHPFQGKKDPDEYIRTSESLARELRRNYELFGTTRYAITDDTFNDSIEKLDRLERAIDLAKLPEFEFVGYIKPELLATKPEMINQLTRLGVRGAYAGIESFNNVARKAMGKGMDIDRVLDSLRLLSSKHQDIHLFSSLIVGLPGDSIEDIYKMNEFLIDSQSTLFKSWYLFPLSIFTYDKQYDETQSPIEKDPEKYGYTIEQRTVGVHCEWKNEFMSYTDSIKVTNDLQQKNRSLMMAGGWSVGTAWNVGATSEEIRTQKLNQMRLGDRAIAIVRQNAINTINRFT